MCGLCQKKAEETARHTEWNAIHVERVTTTLGCVKMTTQQKKYQADQAKQKVTSQALGETQQWQSLNPSKSVDIFNMSHKSPFRTSNDSDTETTHLSQ